MSSIQYVLFPGLVVGAHLIERISQRGYDCCGCPSAQSLPGDLIKFMSSQVFKVTQYFAISYLPKMRFDKDTKYILDIHISNH